MRSRRNRVRVGRRGDGVPRREHTRRGRRACVARRVRACAGRREPRAAVDRPTVALWYEFGARTQLTAAPLRAEANFDTGRLGGDDAGGVVRAGDDFDGTRGDADGVAHADEDSSEHADDADEELQEGRRTLVHGDGERVKFEFEEDSGRAAVVLDLPCIVGYTVLVGVQGRATGSDICRRHDMQKVLVGDEILSRKVSQVNSSM